MVRLTPFSGAIGNNFLCCDHCTQHWFRLGIGIKGYGHTDIKHGFSLGIGKLVLCAAITATMIVAGGKRRTRHYVYKQTAVYTVHTVQYTTYHTPHIHPHYP